MFRNQYDTDVCIYSPQGRLHQLEYAMEAVKLGSVTIGLKSTFHAILLSFNKNISDLASYPRKIIRVDLHAGISFSGLTADSRILSRYMRLECRNYRYYHGTYEYMPISRLLNRVSSKMQISTQRYNHRPYGLGMLIAGFDDLGPHIYQTSPSANYFDCKAMAIGARCQSACTYLEKHLHISPSCSLEELVQHGLKALESTLPPEVKLNSKNVSIAVVGIDKDFDLLEENDVILHLTGTATSDWNPARDSIEQPPENLRRDTGDSDEPQGAGK